MVIQFFGPTLWLRKMLDKFFGHKAYVQVLNLDQPNPGGLNLDLNAPVFRGLSHPKYGMLNLKLVYFRGKLTLVW